MHLTGYVHDTDGSNENIDEPTNEEIIPALTDLADIIADLVTQLERRSISSEECWHMTRAALHNRLSLLAAILPTLPSFNADCDAQLTPLLQRVRTLVKSLPLEVGDSVKVEYVDAWYEGMVTGVEDALRAVEAAVRVRYNGDGGDFAEDPAGGGIRLVAAGRRPAARAGSTTQHTAPFHLSKACVGSSAVEALRALELAVRTLVVGFRNLPMWSSQGARPGRALRKHVARIANLAAEARGWLTGVWPAARLSKGQVGEGLPRRDGAVKARVLRMVNSRQGVRAAVRFAGAAGAWTERLAQAEWGGRFRAVGSAWPGDDGLGWASDSSNEDSDGRSGAGAKRRRRG